MEHLKNIAAGVLAMAAVAALIAAAMFAGAALLEFADWALLHRPKMFRAAVRWGLVAAAIGIAWLVGWQLRKPANA